MAPQDVGNPAAVGLIDLTDEKAGKCSFVIALNSEGQLEISPKGAGARARTNEPDQRQDRMCSGICSAANKTRSEKVPVPSSNKQRISIALINHDTEAFDSLQKNSSSGELTRFVKVYNGEDLRSKPSFVVLEDALVRKRIEHKTESSVIDVQQATEAKTDDFPKDPSLNSGSSLLTPQNRFKTVHNLRNTGNSQEGEGASNNTKMPEALRLSTAPNSQPSEQQAMANTASHVTISFVPASASQSVNPMMYPCQPYLSMARCPSGNYCQFCPLKPPIRQATPDPGCCTCSSCCAMRSASNSFNSFSSCNSCNSCSNNCCPLRPPAGTTAATAAAAATSLHMHPSLNYCQPNLYAMPMVAQHMFAPVLQPAGQQLQQQPQQQQQQQQPQQQQQYPIAGCWYPYPPTALSHCMHQCFCHPMTTTGMGSNCCRMNAAYHHPCPHCGSFCNNPQMQQKPQQQQLESQNVACGNQRQRRYLTKRPKVPASSDTSSLPVNGEGLRRMFGPSPQQQPKSKPDQQVKPSTGRVPKAIPDKEPPRSLSGNTVGRNDSTSIVAKQSTSLYMARFGRTCMLMKPTASTPMPRLLTRRISRYTSVMAWPTNHKSELTKETSLIQKTD